MIKPLQGTRVLSMAEQYPGPYATMILSDLGADVILVERPTGGDPARRFPGHFEALNRGKRSVALDLKSSRGSSALMELAGTADVLIEGYRPGVMERLGLSAHTLRERYPSLIYVSISGFGQTGPLAGRAGHDLSIQGAAGTLRQPEDDGPPPMPSLPLADFASGMFAAMGTLTALLTQRISGDGAYVDVSMFDALVSWMGASIVSELNGLEPAPHPPKDPGYGIFETADGDYITLSIAGEDHLWEALCTGLGLDDLASLTAVEREARRDEVIERVRNTIAARATQSVADTLDERGVTFGTVQTPQEVAHDPHAVARELFIGGASTTGSGLRYVRQPIRSPSWQTPSPAPAPELGEHTREILAEAGLDIELLIAAGVAKAWEPESGGI